MGRKGNKGRKKELTDFSYLLDKDEGKNDSSEIKENDKKEK
ncbi:hypothetical protein [Clostridium sp.]|nr:hypothetical protein [Clostridium sp.]